ncbi:MAG: amidophosphoribosyltransferase [Flavobacteriaceae bacterium]|nr:amidophosphoribosyltransferase [Flavobacteriaceae bacterium]
MSDFIKHECGIAHIRLLKPIEFYKEKYGTAFYGINKMYLMMQKQHNRGQDGAGFASIKLDMQPGQRYISRVRSVAQQPIQDIFSQVNDRINNVLKAQPFVRDNIPKHKHSIPYLGEVMLGHVRYGTFGNNSVESVHPFLRQNNWMHRNLIMAGNFNMTNVRHLFDNLVELGQHPKDYTDTITIMEKIGHFLDDAVSDLFKKLRKEGFNKMECSPLIAERLSIKKILRKASKNWDGGYVMAGMIGHGDSFVFRDPAGIRPAYYYIDDEVVVVASERPVIQTAFNVSFERVLELAPGSAIITKKSGSVKLSKIIESKTRKACSFERIYFSRGSDAEIYEERKLLGNLLVPEILKELGNDIKNTVFSFIPNTAETSFLGMTERAEEYLNKRKTDAILSGRRSLSSKTVTEILSERIRIEKIAIKDVKLRTFITEDSSRDDLVAHVYDVTYGVIKAEDSLLILDDSIVRGTTLKKSILKMLDRLNPKRIIVVSSAPQIRYPDCYGIDMANLEDLVAFQAALELLKDIGKSDLVEAVYKKCLAQQNKDDSDLKNFVKEIYDPFSAKEISDKIADLLTEGGIKAEVKIIFQSIENLHIACPKHTGDWYFTGDYPTAGGNRVVNRAFINYYEGKKERAY